MNAKQKFEFMKFKVLELINKNPDFSINFETDTSIIFNSGEDDEYRIRFYKTLFNFSINSIYFSIPSGNIKSFCIVPSGAFKINNMTMGIER